MDKELLYIILVILRFININILINVGITGLFNKKSVNNYYNQKRITKVTNTPGHMQKYDDINLDDIDNIEFKAAILKFYNLLVSNFSKEDLVNFYNNINELNIKKNSLLVLMSIGGAYSAKENSIRLSLSSSIYHELFHLASTFRDKENNNSYTGFAQKNMKSSKIFTERIGNGLNEGYTQLLTYRYFFGKHEEPNGYIFEFFIAKKLEYIIGEEKMTTMYLNGDLASLIKELNKYVDEEEILKFITRLDLICESDAPLKSVKVKESLFDTYEFLLKVNTIKLYGEYQNGLIDLDTFNNLTNNYFNSFNSVVRIGAYKYHLNNLEEMYMIILDNLNIPHHYVKKKIR